MSSSDLSVEARFAHHLREIRKAAGITQEGLAARMVERGFKWIQTTVTKTEAGSRPLWLNEYVALCEVLGQDPSILLLGLQAPVEDQRSAKVAELRAQLAAAERDYRDAQLQFEYQTFRVHETREALEALEAER